jgi:hypothetical protein
LLYTSSAFNAGERETDGLLINFSENASNDIDLFDADKFPGPDENLSRLHGNDYLSIENRAMPQNDENLPLSTTGYTADNYTFVVDAINIQSNFEVFLLDNYTDTQTQLNEGATQVNYIVDANIPGSVASDRFSVIFGNTTLGVDDNTFGTGFSLYPNPTSNGQFTIKTSGLDGQDVELQIVNLLGQKVFDNRRKVAENGEIQVNASSLAIGVYLVQLRQNQQVFTAKLIVE